MTGWDDELQRGRAMFFDRQGRPMTARQYEATFSEDFESTRRIGEDIIIVGDEPVRVSTVWLGIDHNWSGHGPPIIFETMIFGHPASGEFGDNPCTRYSSELQAREGHAHAVADLIADRLPWFMRYDMEDADDAAD